MRTDVDLKVMKSVEILSGPDAWETNASGQVEPMGRDRVTRARRALDRTFGRHFRGEGVAVSLAGREEREGRAWAVVRFTYPDGDTFDLLVDPAELDASKGPVTCGVPGWMPWPRLKM